MRTDCLIYRAPESEQKQFLWIGDASRMTLPGNGERPSWKDKQMNMNEPACRPGHCLMYPADEVAKLSELQAREGERPAVLPARTAA